MGINIISSWAWGGLAVISTFVSLPAHALILFADSTNIREVRNFWLDSTFNPVQSRTEILGFNEAQRVTLTRNLGFQEPIDDIRNDWDNLTLDNFIPQGTRVSSHMIYLSIPNQTGGSPRLNVSATIRFDRRIIGFNGDFSLFRPDNDLFAPTARNTGAIAQSLEGIPNNIWLPTDFVTRIDNRTIRVDFTQHSGIDPLRIFTAEHVPEPLTIMGSGLALGLGFLFKRKSLTNK